MSGMAEILPTLLSRQLADGGKESPARLKEACQEFEAIFLSKMLRSMKSTVPEGGLIPKSSGHKMFEEMLDDKMAEEIAHTGTLGLADVLQRALADQVKPEQK